MNRPGAGISKVVNGSRGVLNSSARDALAATPPHALRARNLHTPPPTCPPSRPAPALASRPRPRTPPPRYARKPPPRASACSRELSRRAFPSPRLRAGRARATDRARRRDRRDARASRAASFFARIRPPRRAAFARPAPNARRRERLAASRISKRKHPRVVARLLSDPPKRVCRGKKR